MTTLQSAPAYISPSAYLFLAEGKYAAEAHRDGSDARQGDAVGRAYRKILKPLRYRPVVGCLCKGYLINERWVPI